MEIAPLQAAGTGIFALALLHTFAAKFFDVLARRHPAHAGLFHLLGEVEVVFGFWAFVLIVTIALISSGAQAIAYAESRQYADPFFVFVVMVIAASRPVLETARIL
ncbi:MAG: putative Na+/H+ antiporter, partial [Burkholderiales bacterium]